MNPRGVSAFRITLGCALGGYGLWAALHALRIFALPAGVALGRYWPALVALYALLSIAFPEHDRTSSGFYGAVFAASLFLLLAQVRAIGISGSTVWQLIVAAVLVGIAISLLTGRNVLRWHHTPGRSWRFMFDPFDWSGHSDTRENSPPGDGDWDRAHSTSSYAGDLEIDGARSGQELRDHRYHQGMGDIRMDLSSVRLRSGETHIVLDCGMGEIQLLVPEGMAVHVRGQVRLGEVSVFGQTSSGVGPHPVEYATDGYERAERRVRVDMFCGMGEVTASWVR